MQYNARFARLSSVLHCLVLFAVASSGTVEIAASIDGTAAIDRPVYARKGQDVRLYAVVRTGTKIFSDAPSLVIGGKKVTPEPLPQNAKVTWKRIEPTTANMSNTSSGEFRFELIDYKTTTIDSAAHWITADVRPTLTTDYGDGVGTMRYQVIVDDVASPGIDARRGRGAGGLTDNVMRVSIRRDDTFLGFLTEMYGQPYIWASAGTTDRNHQSEHLEGSDCADFLVYGARRMGKKLAYTWTGALPQVSKLLAAGTRGADGIYRGKDGKMLPFTKIGDLVLFPRHVGVLAQDRGQAGVLDDQDLMMHTLFDTPKEQAIADSTYADQPLELRRLR